MPVILFCENVEEYKNELPKARIFDDRDPGQASSLLKYFRKQTNCTVITTSVTCRGVDFLFAAQQAYVVHVCLPKSYIRLQ